MVVPIGSGAKLASNNPAPEVITVAAIPATRFSPKLLPKPNPKCAFSATVPAVTRAAVTSTAPPTTNNAGAVMISPATTAAAFAYKDPCAQ